MFFLLVKKAAGAGISHSFECFEPAIFRATTVCRTWLGHPASLSMGETPRIALESLGSQPSVLLLKLLFPRGATGET